jgi:hypothetical protein
LGLPLLLRLLHLPCLYQSTFQDSRKSTLRHTRLSRADKRQQGFHYAIRSVRLRIRPGDRNGWISLQKKALRSIHHHQRLQIRTVGLNVLGAIMPIVRKVCIQSKLPHRIWPCIVSHATRLLNRTPVQRKEWQLLLQMVYRRKPNIAHLKINTELICSSPWMIFLPLYDRIAYATSNSPRQL